MSKNITLNAEQNAVLDGAKVLLKNNKPKNRKDVVVALSKSAHDEADHGRKSKSARFNASVVILSAGAAGFVKDVKADADYFANEYTKIATSLGNKVDEASHKQYKSRFATYLKVGAKSDIALIVRNALEYKALWDKNGNEPSNLTLDSALYSVCSFINKAKSDDAGTAAREKELQREIAVKAKKGAPASKKATPLSKVKNLATSCDKTMKAVRNAEAKECIRKALVLIEKAEQLLTK